MKVSPQAHLALLGYLLLIVSLFLPFQVSTDKTDKSYSLGARLASAATMLIPMTISLLTINCMVTGAAGRLGCSVLAWLNSASVFVWGLFVILFALMLVFKKSDNTPKATATIASLHAEVNQNSEPTGKGLTLGQAVAAQQAQANTPQPQQLTTSSVTVSTPDPVAPSSNYSNIPTTNDMSGSFDQVEASLDPSSASYSAF